jgi:phosphate uptake regulator
MKSINDFRDAVLLPSCRQPFGGNVDAIHAAAGQMWITRHLERVGDHVANVAERACFMNKGETLAKTELAPSMPLGFLSPAH